MFINSINKKNPPVMPVDSACRKSVFCPSFWRGIICLLALNSAKSNALNDELGEEQINDNNRNDG